MTVPEAKNWLEDAKYEDKHDDFYVDSDMTVNDWFEYWQENIVSDRAPNTRRNHRERYKINIRPHVGKMMLSEVKPMHCKKILNDMKDQYAGSTILQTYITMGTLFKSALDNDLIRNHPMDGVNLNAPVKERNDIRFLSVDEQKRFLETAKRSHNYYQYAFVLETGLRTGELIGLTWDAIDFEKKTLTVNKTLEYRHDNKYWRAGPPKTVHSYRTIPLTSRAIESGMQPKVLQMLLGHASIQTTMNTYVHVTDESLEKAIAQFESNKDLASLFE